jgi:hypothetical protein
MVINLKMLLGLTACCFVLILLVSGGVAYSSPVSSYKKSANLVFTSVSERSGPQYISLTVDTQLPSANVQVSAGPFAPGDTLVVSFTVKNTGKLPVELEASIFLSNAYFHASLGNIPQTLKPGGSFTSTFSITLDSNAGNSLMGQSATITLTIGSENGED